MGRLGVFLRGRFVLSLLTVAREPSKLAHPCKCHLEPLKKTPCAPVIKAQSSGRVQLIDYMCVRAKTHLGRVASLLGYIGHGALFMEQ